MAASDAVAVDLVDGITTVRVSGDFDAVIADAFVHAARHGDGPVRVDLAGVTFLDSAGLSAMAQVVAALDGEGRDLQVVTVSPIARRVIGICGMEELLGLADGDAVGP